MYRKFCICLALVSAIATSQLSLGIIQVCSWVDMFSDYVVETGSMKTSLDWTFNGQHPCEGCDFVSDQVGESEKGKKTAFAGVASLKLVLAPLVMEVLVLEPPKVVGTIDHDGPLLLSEVLDLVIPPPRFC